MVVRLADVSTAVKDLGSNTFFLAGIVLLLALVGLFLGFGYPGTQDVGSPSEDNKAAVTESKDKVGASPSSAVSVGTDVSNVSFSTINGNKLTVSEVEKSKVMLWFLSTWCPGCKQNARLLERQKLGNMHIIAIKTYKNAGYRGGPTIDVFAERYAPATLQKQDWHWTNATKRIMQRFNPNHKIDRHYLINATGHIVTAGGLPSQNLPQIQQFATG